MMQGGSCYLFHFFLGEVDQLHYFEPSTAQDAPEVLCVDLWCVQDQLANTIVLVANQQCHLVIAGLAHVWLIWGWGGEKGRRSIHFSL